MTKKLHLLKTLIISIALLSPFANISYASHEGGAAVSCPAADKARDEAARIEGIYSGRGGARGDLIRVTVKDGTLLFRRFFKKQRTAYEPVSLLIAIGERKTVRFQSTTSKMKRSVTIAYTYRGLQLDRGRDAKLFTYDKKWNRGLRYAGITLGQKTASKAQGISIRINTAEPSRESYLAYKANTERYYVAEIERARRACAAQVRAQIVSQEEQARLAAIYSGRSGVYGDLIRVSVQGGTMEFRNRRRDYQPTSFLIASGERKTVRFISSNGRRTIFANMVYTNGRLRFDSGRGARNFVYDPGWRYGLTYRSVTLNKYTSTDAQAITISIRILDPRRNRDRYRYIIVVPGGHGRGYPGGYRSERRYYSGYPQKRRTERRDDHDRDRGDRYRDYTKKDTSRDRERKHIGDDERGRDEKPSHGTGRSDRRSDINYGRNRTRADASEKRDAGADRPVLKTKPIENRHEKSVEGKSKKPDESDDREEKDRDRENHKDKDKKKTD